MKIEYDRIADAAYIRLADAPWAYTKALDDTRNMDYSASHEPIGIEWLCVSDGVDLSGVPHASDISKLMSDRNIKVYA